MARILTEMLWQVTLNGFAVDLVHAGIPVISKITAARPQANTIFPELLNSPGIEFDSRRNRPMSRVIQAGCPAPMRWVLSRLPQATGWRSPRVKHGIGQCLTAPEPQS
jgi:hypothetical protein